MRAGTHAGFRASHIDALHRELGMSGYFASEHIPSSRRKQLLARARDQAVSPLSRDLGSADALAMIVQRAKETVELGLVAPGISDHMHLAYVHLLGAQELLAQCAQGQHQSLGISEPAT
jgi:hypothetical protein